MTHHNRKSGDHIDRMADAQVSPAAVSGPVLSYNVTNERGWNDPPPLAFGGTSTNGSATRRRIDPRKRVGHNLNGTVHGSPSYPVHHSPAVKHANFHASDSPVASTLTSLTDYFQKAASFVTGDDSSFASSGKFHHSSSDPDLHIGRHDVGQPYPEVLPVNAHGGGTSAMSHNISTPNFKPHVVNHDQLGTPYCPTGGCQNPTNALPHVTPRRVSAATPPLVEPSNRGSQSGPPSLTVAPTPCQAEVHAPASILPSAVAVQLGSHPRGGGSTPPLARPTHAPSAFNQFALGPAYEQISAGGVNNFDVAASHQPTMSSTDPGASVNRSLLSPLSGASGPAEISGDAAKAPSEPNVLAVSPHATHYSSMPPALGDFSETRNLGFSRSVSTPGFPAHRLSPTASFAGPPPVQGYYSHRPSTGKNSPSQSSQKGSLPETESPIVGSDDESMKATVAALQVCVEECAGCFTNRTLEDITKRILCFQQMWLNGKLSAAVKAKMAMLVQALKTRDFPQADSIHKILILENASEVMQWMVAVKKLIITSQQMSIESSREHAPLS